MDMLFVSPRAAKRGALALCALLVALCLFGCQKTPAFVGSCVANADEYVLEFEVLNTVHSTEMTLKAGDSVRVQIDAAGGTLDLFVYPSGQKEKPIYRANGAESGDFLLTVAADGAYTFLVEGKDAKGSARFILAR